MDLTKVWTTDADFNAQSNFTDILVQNDGLVLAAGKKQGTALLRFNAGGIVEWKELTWTDSFITFRSEIKIRIKAGNDVTTSYSDFTFNSSVEFTSYFVTTPALLVDISQTLNSQYIELEVDMSTQDIQLYPVSLSDITLTYRADTTPPKAVTNLRVAEAARSIAPLWDR